MKWWVSLRRTKRSFNTIIERVRQIRHNHQFGSIQVNKSLDEKQKAKANYL